MASAIRWYKPEHLNLLLTMKKALLFTILVTLPLSLDSCYASSRAPRPVFATTTTLVPPITEPTTTTTTSDTTTTTSDPTTTSTTTESTSTTTTELPTTTTTTEVTTTLMPCSPEQIGFGQADGSGSIEVTYSGYVLNGLAMTATMTVSCTAGPNMWAAMELNNSIQPPESSIPSDTVTITLSCSLDTNVWNYMTTFAGQVYVIPVESVSCLQL